MVPAWLETTPEEAVMEVAWSRRESTCPVLLVEGHRDFMLFSRVGLADECTVLSFRGKDSVHEALGLLREAEERLILAVVDWDELLLTGVGDDPDVVRPDHVDLEVMLLHSSALSRLLDVWASADKYENTDQVRDRVLDLAAELSLPLRASQVFKLHLNFERVDYTKFIDSRDLTLALNRLIETILNDESAGDVTREQLTDNMGYVREITQDPSVLANGHIAIQVLSKGLNRVFGSRSAQEVRPEILERSLVNFFDKDDFRETELCARIRIWAENNNCTIAAVAD